MMRCVSPGGVGEREGEESKGVGVVCVRDWKNREERVYKGREK